MDELAVKCADDTFLRELGIKATGDLIRLKIMCSGNTGVDERKKELKEIITNGGKTMSSPPKQVKLSESKPKASRLINVSWKHFDKKAGRYVLVKASKGGGLCKIKFPLETTKNILLAQLIEHFWTCRKGIATGKKKEDFHFLLTDGKEDPISDIIVLDTGEAVPFTVGSFCRKIKLARPRLYLLTKLKSITARMDLSDVDDSGDEFQTPRRTHATSTPKPVEKIDLTKPEHHENTSQPIPMENISRDSPLQTSALIGTTEQRVALNNEIQRAYDESLEADREKDRIDQEEKREQDRLQDLMHTRKAKLKPEPELTDDHIVIAIRHPELGHKSRLFQTETRMMEVYWWTGSLNMTPEYFGIKDYMGKTCYPDELSKSGIYNICTRQEPMNMSIDDEIGFDEFSPLGNVGQNAYQTLMKLRDEYYKEHFKVQDDIVFVKRESVYEDMLKIFKKRGVQHKKLSVLFKDEMAYGEGVSRDAFACFFKDVYDQLEGENEKVPPAHMDLEELELIGNIITYAFLVYNLFPVKISISALKKEMFSVQVSHEELLQAYLHYLPNRERETVEKFATGHGDAQPIMDILMDSRIYTKPTKDNIYELCIRAAEMILIRYPSSSVKALVDGMGAFWKSVSCHMFMSLYKVTTPNADTVIAALNVEELCAQDGKLTTYLHRYIRACSEKGIETFLRFVTGSASLVPGDVIKVQFITQSHSILCPRSQTCFKILTLPRNYTSFQHMQNTLDKFFQNEDWWTIQDDVE